MRRRAWFYTITVGAFAAGALIGCIAVMRMGGRGVVWGFGLIFMAGALRLLKKTSPAKDKKVHAPAV